MSIGYDSAARELENFFLGAVMQQDPFLEEFSTLPDEPPDAEPCHTDQSVARSEPLEQGTLFDLPEPAQRKPKATHPTVTQKPTATTDPDLPKPKPYSLHHIPYADFKRIFNGDSALALYWFNKQYLKS